MNSGRGKEKWKHVRAWLEAFEKFLPCVTNAYCVLEVSKGKCLLSGWQNSRKLFLAEYRRKEGEVTARCLRQLGKCVETLLSSKAGCRGIKCDPVLLHASIHKNPPTLLMNFNRLLWHIINFKAAVHVLLICYGICNWIWPPVTLKIWLSVPKDIHMFYEGRVCFNKPFNQEHMLNKQKAFIDFINSKTMSTLSQANYCTAYQSAMVCV